MVRVNSRISINNRILMCDNYGSDSSGECDMGLVDGIFEFFDRDSVESSPGSTTSSNNYGEEEDDDTREDKGNYGDDKRYWENQHQLLHATICRSNSLETKVRNATKEAVKEAQLAGNCCICQRPMIDDNCRNCLVREVCARLQNAGFDSAICKSKWRTSPDIPSGEHTFVDVVDKTNPKKGEIRIIIELNFRAEFKVARGNEEYNKLIKRLPEVFVGKIERLQALIKILCSAAKKCMKENKMHMGPWRKHKYMQAKWLGTCERTTLTPGAWSSSTAGHERAPPTRRVSMLTMDLSEIIHSLHSVTTIRVA